MSKDLSILIVDDVAGARKVLRRLLVKLGYLNLFEADSANAALAQAEQQQFNLVISDLFLGDMKGQEFCQCLRQLSGYNEVPILVVTGESEAKEKETALSAGADAYLLKPFGINSLAEAIQQSIASHGAGSSGADSPQN